MSLLETSATITKESINPQVSLMMEMANGDEKCPSFAIFSAQRDHYLLVLHLSWRALCCRRVECPGTQKRF